MHICSRKVFLVTLLEIFQLSMIRAAIRKHTMVGQNILRGRNIVSRRGKNILNIKNNSENFKGKTAARGVSPPNSPLVVVYNNAVFRSSTQYRRYLATKSKCIVGF